MNRARNTCSSQCGALRRFVIRKSTSKLRNQAHAPQSAAAARTLCLLPTIHWPAFSRITFEAVQIALAARFSCLSVSTEHVNPYQLWKNCGLQKRQPSLSRRRCPTAGGMFIYSGISLKVSRCSSSSVSQTKWCITTEAENSAERLRLRFGYGNCRMRVARFDRSELASMRQGGDGGRGGQWQ